MILKLNLEEDSLDYGRVFVTPATSSTLLSGHASCRTICLVIRPSLLTTRLLRSTEVGAIRSRHPCLIRTFVDVRLTLFGGRERIGGVYAFFDWSPRRPPASPTSW